MVISELVQELEEDEFKNSKKRNSSALEVFWLSF